MSGHKALALALVGGLTGCPHSADSVAANGVLAFESASFTATESDRQVIVRVTRSEGSSGSVSFTLSTADGTATAGDDYTATSTTVTFADGDTAAKQVTVPVLDDPNPEPSETFTVTLTAPSGGASLGASTATVSIVDDDAGHPGFSFVKLDAAGQPLVNQQVSYDQDPWACVSDRATGLTWEVRTTDGGLRDRRWRYSWYDGAGLRPGNLRGASNGGTCVDTTSCDTAQYAGAVNAARLCGHADWRLPTRSELLSLVDYGAAAPPLIDAGFFPDGEADDWWTSNRDFADETWVVSFAGGANRSLTPGEALPVRLVRRGIP